MNWGLLALHVLLEGVSNKRLVLVSIFIPLVFTTVHPWLFLIEVIKVGHIKFALYLQTGFFRLQLSSVNKFLLLRERTVVSFPAISSSRFRERMGEP